VNYVGLKKDNLYSSSTTLVCILYLYTAHTIFMKLG